MCPDFKTILYEKKNGVAVITLNRPEVLNALNRQMNIDLKKAFKEAKEYGKVRVIILTGSGRGFCSGADVRDFAAGETYEDLKRNDRKG